MMTGRLFASVTAGVVLLLALLGAYSAVHPDKARGGPSPTQAITVTGTGLVTTTPDRADFSFGVQTERASADAATAATAARMQRVINALRASGIANRDIQTQQVSISPRYDNTGIVGYSASNVVSAKIRDIDTAGAVIDAATGAGATSVYGPAFFRSDQQTLIRTALRAAVADARAKAQAIAAGSGATVGRVLSVVEHGAIPPASGGTTGTTTTGSTGVATVPPTPVNPGEQSIQDTITATFAAS
jgi:uncharacterized protein YggE